MKKKRGLKSIAFRKLVFFISIAMLLEMLLFCSIYYRKNVKEYSVNARENLTNMQSYLKSYLEEIDALAKNVNYNYYLQNYLSSALEEEYRYTEPSNMKNMREYEMSSQAFSDLLFSRTDLSSIMVFGKKSLLFHKSIYKYRNMVMNYMEQEWYAYAVENPKKAIITGPTLYSFLDTNNKMISLSRQIESYKDGEFLGVILINLNLNKISEICESFQGKKESFLCVVNEQGKLVYQQQKGKEILNLDDEDVLTKLYEKQGDSKGFQIKIEGIEYIITPYYMEETGWTLFNIMPYAVIISDLKETSIFIIAAVGSIFILILFLTNSILTGVVEPVKKLQRHMERVSIENLNQQVSIQSEDEIGKLSQNFNEMLVRIEHLKEQVVKEQEDKRKYELQALQAQINPHFLYNTLDSIIWMAETDDSNVVAMTEALAKFFRISLNKGNEEITVKKEMEHVENYLIIQSMRYVDKFTYEIQVDEKVEKCKVIKLIVQPIVENCIYHGIKKQRGSGHIKIEAFPDGENLKIVVQDDGCGITKEMCQKILSDEIQPENISGSGIGVKNVNERIKLRFGSRYGLAYFSEEGNGTKVEFTLPIVKEETKIRE